MLRVNILRPVLRYSPIAMAIIGIAAASALGWFSYRYVYRAITTAQVSSTLQLALAVELIDPKRVEAADAFFRATDALPPMDTRTIRDIFSAPRSATPSPQLPVSAQR